MVRALFVAVHGARPYWGSAVANAACRRVASSVSQRAHTCWSGRSRYAGAAGVARRSGGGSGRRRRPGSVRAVHGFRGADGDHSAAERLARGWQRPPLAAAAGIACGFREIEQVKPAPRWSSRKSSADEADVLRRRAVRRAGAEQSRCRRRRCSASSRVYSCGREVRQWYSGRTNSWVSESDSTASRSSRKPRRRRRHEARALARLVDDLSRRAHALGAVVGQQGFRLSGP